MREIKFRGKRVDDEKRVYGSLHKCLGYQKSYDDDEPSDFCKECKDHISFEEE